MKENRIIIHIDMDYFFAQIEERENPRFKGKPVVVGSDPKDGKGRGVVSTCNYEARKFGIKSGMPISWAWRKCPDAIFLPVDMELYQKTSEKIMEIAQKFSEKMEVMSVDEAYLDVSNVKTYAKAEKIARDLKNEIWAKEKLTCSIGVGPNKLISKIACKMKKPNGLMVVKPEEVSNFLNPLDIQELPGIGPKTGAKLRAININKVSDLKKIARAELQNIFGKVGERFYQISRGIDEDPVVEGREIKSIGKETTFENDTRDSKIIFKAFDELLAGVHSELKNSGFLCKTITVVCRFSGFETHTKDKTLTKATDDLKILEKEAKNLLLRFIVENPKPIRLVGVRLKIEN